MFEVDCLWIDACIIVFEESLKTYPYQNKSTCSWFIQLINYYYRYNLRPGNLVGLKKKKRVRERNKWRKQITILGISLLTYFFWLSNEIYSALPCQTGTVLQHWRRFGINTNLQRRHLHLVHGPGSIITTHITMPIGCLQLSPTLLDLVPVSTRTHPPYKVLYQRKLHLFFI